MYCETVVPMAAQYLARRVYCETVVSMAVQNFARRVYYVVRMLSASFMTSSMVRLARCNWAETKILQ